MLQTRAEKKNAQVTLFIFYPPNTMTETTPPTAQKKINLYSYADASEELKKKILENHADINVNHSSWADWTIDEEKADLEEQGFLEPTIYFSGFWSQGDGACFDIKKFDVAQYIKFHKLEKDFPKITSQPAPFFGYIKKLDSHYSHENTRSFYVNIEESEFTLQESTEEWRNAYMREYEKEAELLEAHIEETRYNLSKNIYKNLQNVYESLCEDEEVIATLEANEYLFNEDGQIESI